MYYVLSVCHRHVWLWNISLMEVAQRLIQNEHKARAAGKTPSAFLVHVFVFLLI